MHKKRSSKWDSFFYALPNRANLYNLHIIYPLQFPRSFSIWKLQFPSRSFLWKLQFPREEIIVSSYGNYNFL